MLARLRLALFAAAWLLAMGTTMAEESEGFDYTQAGAAIATVQSMQRMVEQTGGYCAIQFPKLATEIQESATAWRKRNEDWIQAAATLRLDARDRVVASGMMTDNASLDVKFDSVVNEAATKLVAQLGSIEVGQRLQACQRMVSGVQSGTLDIAKREPTDLALLRRYMQ